MSVVEADALKSAVNEPEKSPHPATEGIIKCEVNAELEANCIGENTLGTLSKSIQSAVTELSSLSTKAGGYKEPSPASKASNVNGGTRPKSSVVKISESVPKIVKSKKRLPKDFNFEKAYFELKEVYIFLLVSSMFLIALSMR